MVSMSKPRVVFGLKAGIPHSALIMYEQVSPGPRDISTPYYIFQTAKVMLFEFPQPSLLNGQRFLASILLEYVFEQVQAEFVV